MQRVPRILSINEFETVGFYQYLDLAKCILKAMSTGLRLSSQLPAELPTRAALIGRFHHCLMAHVQSAHSLSELEAAIEAEIVGLQSEVDTWPHLRRSGSVSGWDLVNRSAAVATHAFRRKSKQRHMPYLSGSERDLRSSDGRMVGRPDWYAVVGDIAYLREFKSGTLRNDDGAVYDEYQLQLNFYSVLLYDVFAVHSVEAQLESLGGETLRTSVSRAEAQQVRDRVEEGLQAANEQIKRAMVASDLAAPSARTCQYCQKRLICERFQQHQFDLGLPGKAFVLRGLVESIESSQTGAISIRVRDRYSKRSTCVRLPESYGSSINSGCEYVFADVAGGRESLAWREESRLFGCD